MKSLVFMNFPTYTLQYATMILIMIINTNSVKYWCYP